MKTLAELLEAVSADLGATPADEPFLASRIAAVIARMRSITHRWLWPLAEFEDEWAAQPRSSRATPRQWPVVKVMSAQIGGSEIDLAASPILPYGGAGAFLVGLPRGEVSVIYQAGCVDLPPELYELVLSAVRGAWRSRAEPEIKKLSVVDVGTVEYGSAAGWYGGDVVGVDPLLGPLASLLEPYIDASVLNPSGDAPARSTLLREVSHG